MKKSTENPTSEALPQKLPSHFTAQKQRTITEEQTIRRKARLWDRHTRNRCPQDRPQREKGKIARGDCKREDKGSSGKLRGKEGTGQLQGEELEEKLARQRIDTFRPASKADRRQHAIPTFELSHGHNLFRSSRNPAFLHRISFRQSIVSPSVNAVPKNPARIYSARSSEQANSPLHLPRSFKVEVHFQNNHETKKRTNLSTCPLW